jgi:tripartite-type tricarboxylate transporter receptor subunit TctC
MLRSRCLSMVLATVVAGLALSGFLGTAWGGEYPTKNITFIIPYAPGGTSDPLVRLIAQVSEPLLKGKFVLVNKPGAGSVLGTAEVVQAKPDGYTIGLAADYGLGLAPQVSKLPYNGPEDYQPIIKTIWFGTVILVRADSPWKTLADLTAEAKKRPGQLKIGLNGTFGASELAMTYYNKIVGIDVNFVPFSGGAGENMTNLLGGHIDVSATSVTAGFTQVAAGKVRALAVVPGDRNPAYPGVPSMKELGYDFPTPVTQYFIIGPKGMDRAIVDKLYKVFAEAMKSPPLQQHAATNGAIIDIAGPEESVKEIRSMWTIYTKVIKDFNMEVRK